MRETLEGSFLPVESASHCRRLRKDPGRSMDRASTVNLTMRFMMLSGTLEIDVHVVDQDDEAVR